MSLEFFVLFFFLALVRLLRVLADDVDGRSTQINNKKT